MGNTWLPPHLGKKKKKREKDRCYPSVGQKGIFSLRFFCVVTFAFWNELEVYVEECKAKGIRKSMGYHFPVIFHLFTGSSVIKRRDFVRLMLAQHISEVWWQVCMDAHHHPNQSLEIPVWNFNRTVYNRNNNNNLYIHM